MEIPQMFRKTLINLTVAELLHQKVTVMQLVKWVYIFNTPFPSLRSSKLHSLKTVFKADYFNIPFNNVSSRYRYSAVVCRRKIRNKPLSNHDEFENIRNQ